MAEHRLPSLAEFAEAEHCVLEDVTARLPTLNDKASVSSLPAREISDEFVIRDTLRGFRTTVRLFAEGWADIAVKCRGSSTSHQRFNLNYLHPVPKKSLHYPAGLLKFTGILALLTGACAGSWQLDFYPGYAQLAMLAGGVLTLVSLLVVFYRTHQVLAFRTLHGRAAAMRFRAGLGAGLPLHARIPRIVNAITAASRSTGDDTATYLRSEMREHYRLRNEGILSDDECAAGTDRILSEFDGAL